MRCRRSRIMISEYVDGALDRRKSARLERHIETCAECRGVLTDLRTVVGQAGKLETPPVPDGAWSRIRARLAEAREPAPRLERSPFFRPRLAPALTALALMAVAAGGIFFGQRLGRKPVALSPEARERATLAKLDEAERYYELAIKSLGEALAGRKETLSPQVSEMFRRNLEVVDMTIQACREAVRSEPDNVGARDFLLDAYKEKVVLLDDLLDMSRNASRGETPGEVM